MFIKKAQHQQNNNLEESYTEKKAKHKPSNWTMFTRCSFNEKKNLIITEEKIVYIEKLCKKLKECTLKIINYEKKGNDATKEENKSYEEQETCHISEKSFVWIKMMKIILIGKRLKITVIIQEILEELLVPNVT